MVANAFDAPEAVDTDKALIKSAELAIPEMVIEIVWPELCPV